MRSPLLASTIALLLGSAYPALSAPETPAQSAPQFSDEDVICAIKDILNVKSLKTVHPPRMEVAKSLDWISTLIGISPNFQLFGADFSSSPVAFAARRGKERYIVYDRAQFSKVKGALSWFDISVLAHEVGHHINGHTAGYNGSSWEAELEADRFAGFVVGKLGGSLKDALSTSKIYSEKGSPSHPPRWKRELALTEGWNQGQSETQ